MAEVCPKKACVDAILTVARDGARCTGRKLGLYRKPRSQQGLRINCVAHEEWIPQTRARRATQRRGVALEANAWERQSPVPGQRECKEHVAAATLKYRITEPCDEGTQGESADSE